MRQEACDGNVLSKRLAKAVLAIRKRARMYLVASIG
jgi:hypothetical protein